MCNVEYNPIEKNKYMILAKIVLDVQYTSDLLGKLSPQGDNQIIKFLKFKTIVLPEDPTVLEECKNEEGIFAFEDVNSWAGRNFFKLKLKANQRVMLIIECCPNYNTADGSLKMEFFSKNEFNLKQYDLTETFEYVDKYNPNKYGLIFRERLFVNNTEVHGTFMAKLSDYVDPNVQAGEQLSNQKDTAKKGGGKAAPVVSGGPDRNFERDPIDRKRIYLELFQEEKLIMTASGRNECGFANVVLSGSKENHANYYLQGRLELRDCPEATSVNKFTENLYWN